MCADSWTNYKEADSIEGVCDDCGEPTIDGVAMGGCNYSPVICKTCGDSPCDESC